MQTGDVDNAVHQARLSYSERMGQDNVTVNSGPTENRNHLNSTGTCRLLAVSEDHKHHRTHCNWFLSVRVNTSPSLKSRSSYNSCLCYSSEVLSTWMVQQPCSLSGSIYWKGIAHLAVLRLSVSCSVQSNALSVILFLAFLRVPTLLGSLGTGTDCRWANIDREVHS